MSRSEGSPADPVMAAYYERGLEQDRLSAGLGEVEFVRTVEIIESVLPATPGVVADIGGGPGRYALWLADRGHAVLHRDAMPLHVEQVRDADPGGRIDTAVGDARSLDLPDACCDAVLLLGPLYHLRRRGDRVAALREAARVAKPRAPVLAAAISRWAPRLHGHLVEQLYRQYPAMHGVVARVETDGVLLPVTSAGFNGYCHTPDELRAEAQAAGLLVEDLVGVEGLSFALPDLYARLADPSERDVVLASARAVERVPELLGLSPHLVLTARAPG